MDLDTSSVLGLTLRNRIIKEDEGKVGVGRLRDCGQCRSGGCAVVPGRVVGDPRKSRARL